MISTRPDEAKGKVKKKARAMRASWECVQIKEKGFLFYLLWWHRVMKSRNPIFFVMCAKRFLIRV